MSVLFAVNYNFMMYLCVKTEACNETDRLGKWQENRKLPEWKF